jgi:competence ComEA-like helix-hairpin-helix protein
MIRARALLLLGALAIAPSIHRRLRSDPRPVVVRSTEYTAEADRIFFGEKMDLNRADPEALELIPGIGPSLAKRIVEDRARNGEFSSISDVERVPGIGPAKRAQIAAWVEVEARLTHSR